MHFQPLMLCACFLCSCRYCIFRKQCHKGVKKSQTILKIATNWAYNSQTVSDLMHIQLLMLCACFLCSCLNCICRKQCHKGVKKSRKILKIATNWAYNSQTVNDLMHFQLLMLCACFLCSCLNCICRKQCHKSGANLWWQFGMKPEVLNT